MKTEIEETFNGLATYTSPEGELYMSFDEFREYAQQQLLKLFSSLPVDISEEQIGKVVDQSIRQYWGGGVGFDPEDKFVKILAKAIKELYKNK